MVFDQCDQDIERSAAESERLSSSKQQPLRRNQVEWAKRECARRPPLTRPVMVDCSTSGGDPPISPASLESEGGAHGPFLAFSPTPKRIAFRSVMRRSASSIMVWNSMHVLSHFSLISSSSIERTGRFAFWPSVERRVTQPSRFKKGSFGPTTGQFRPKAPDRKSRQSCLANGRKTSGRPRVRCPTSEKPVRYRFCRADIRAARSWSSDERHGETRLRR